MSQETMIPEKELLTNFLIGSELQGSMTLSQFSKLFPTSHQSHPQVKDLHRAYLDVRNQTRDMVRQNIEEETSKIQVFAPAPSFPSSFSDSFSNANQGQDDPKDKESQRLLILEEESAKSKMELEDIDQHLTLDQAMIELSTIEKRFELEVEKLENECHQFSVEFADRERELAAIKIPFQHQRSGSVLDLGQQDIQAELEELIRLCDMIVSAEDTTTA